jgi:superfamily I DNA/RNA helicase
MGYTPGQICIVGPSARMRDEVQAALLRLGVHHAELRQDADFESENVKVSTIESAKGHEFRVVFIMGLVEGVLPNARVAADEIAREAARLYVAMTRARESLTITYSPRAGYPASRFLIVPRWEG